MPASARLPGLMVSLVLGAVFAGPGLAQTAASAINGEAAASELDAGPTAAGAAPEGAGSARAAPSVTGQPMSALARLFPAQSVIATGADGLAADFALSRPVPFAVRVISDPPRLVIDTQEVDWTGVKALTGMPGPVSDLRFGALRAGWSRLVLVLNAPFSLGTAEMVTTTPDGPARLRILLLSAESVAGTGAGGSAGQPDPASPRKHADGEGPPGGKGRAGEKGRSGGKGRSGRTEPAEGAIQAPGAEFAGGEGRMGQGVVLRDLPPALPSPGTAVMPKRRQTGEGPVIVVLDPGHGGIDPGAETDGQSEARLMLTFARELREALLRSSGFNVILTRDDDVFLPLEARLSLARAVGADVFLSLHADALADGVARGATIYTLSDTASDDASALLAERHARDDLLSGVDLSATDDLIASVLMDMARSETRPRSDRLASDLVAAISASVGGMHKRPRLAASFAVLKAPDIPSALIELGFLSSAKDRKRLLDPEWRARMADAIATGLQTWAAGDAAEAQLLRQ